MKQYHLLLKNHHPAGKKFDRFSLKKTGVNDIYQNENSGIKFCMNLHNHMHIAYSPVVEIPQKIQIYHR